MADNYFMETLYSGLEGFNEALFAEVHRLPANIAGFARHAVTGGKRIRPRVVQAFATACGDAPGDAHRFAVAVEFIHKASLIQDDLPCMDFASVRSGRPALHAICSSAEAVLVSDALIAHAFRVCAESSYPAKAVLELSEAVVSLADGQAADLAEGTTQAGSDWRAVADAKTGALFCASAHLGVIASGKETDEVHAVAERFGCALGRIYQWYDDLRDGDAGTMSRSLIEPELRAIRTALTQLPDPRSVEMLFNDLSRLMPM